MTEVISYEMFPVEDAGPVVPLPPPPGRKGELVGLSPGARRTRRRLWDLQDGIHPLTKLPLHANAPQDSTASDRVLLEFTCGTCIHKIVRSVGKKEKAKCDKAVSFSEYSDLRNWFPACVAYRPIRRNNV